MQHSVQRDTSRLPHLELTRTKVADGLNAETAATETIRRVAANFIVNDFEIWEYCEVMIASTGGSGSDDSVS